MAHLFLCAQNPVTNCFDAESYAGFPMAWIAPRYPVVADAGAWPGIAGCRTVCPVPRSWPRPDDWPESSRLLGGITLDPWPGYPTEGCMTLVQAARPSAGLPGELNCPADLVGRAIHLGGLLGARFEAVGSPAFSR